MRARWSMMLAALAVGTAIAACETPIEQNPCKNVPAGGCPLSHGQACEDPACEAAYACNPDGTWTLDHTCPARDGGDTSDSADASASADATAAIDSGDATVASDSGDASEAHDAALPLNDASWIDAPPGAGGGPGCVDLEQ